MVEKIELGEHGLFYLTDTDDPGVFIAANSESEARELATQAHKALVTGADIPGHAMHDHSSGARITIPKPDGMNADQRRETIDRLTKHMHERRML